MRGGFDKTILVIVVAVLALELDPFPRAMAKSLEQPGNPRAPNGRAKRSLDFVCPLGLIPCLIVLSETISFRYLIDTLAIWDHVTGHNVERETLTLGEWTPRATLEASHGDPSTA